MMRLRLLRVCCVFGREAISRAVRQATTATALDVHGEIATGMCENARPVDWNDLKYLLALKRAGTLAGAARALSVDHSTVSRRLVALEEAIGCQLLQRTPEGLCFTDAGNTAAASAEAMDAAAVGLLSKLAGGDELDAGIVRLTCAEGFIPYLVAELQQMRVAHPQLSVELLPSTAALDLLRREADVALRMFRPTQAALVARRVGKLGWSLYASDAYLARKGPPQSLGDLSGHDLIAYDAELKAGFGPRWLEEHAGSARVVMRCDSVRGAVLAITQGVGIGTMPCYLAAGEPSLRRLTPEVTASAEIFLVTAPDLQALKRIRLVLEMVAAMFDRHRSLFAGSLA
jgi:DNA-binding transcriptional LysR family regulator